MPNSGIRKPATSERRKPAQRARLTPPTEINRLKKKAPEAFPPRKPSVRLATSEMPLPHIVVKAQHRFGDRTSLP